MPTKAPTTRKSTKTTTTVKKVAPSKRKEVVAAAQVDPPETVVAVEAAVEVEVEAAPVERKRRGPTRDVVMSSFEDLVTLVDGEIERLRSSPTKSKGIKFLRSINKRVKALQSQSGRVMKQKKTTTRAHNKNSGFLKPVHISQEMAKFTGWDQAELRSRVDVTKYICNYIRENNLQNSADRRQIVADNKLSKLLGYDAKNAEEPLTYYRIQTYLKSHFVN